MNRRQRIRNTLRTVDLRIREVVARRSVLGHRLEVVYLYRLILYLKLILHNSRQARRVRIVNICPASVRA